MENADDVRVKLGIRVKELRKKAGFSQAILAGKCDLDKSYIASIEAGKRNVSIEKIVQIARAFGLQPHELMDW